MAEMLTEDDLIVSGGPLTEADVVKVTRAGKPRPAPKRKPQPPSKPARKPFVAPPIGPEDQEGYVFEMEGGQPAMQLKMKDARSLDFRSPEISFEQAPATPGRLKPVQARRRANESENEFAIRQSKFAFGQRQQERQEKGERAAVRAKVMPKRGLEKYPIAAAEGVAGVLTPVFGVLDRINPNVDTQGAFEPENQMPRLNADEAGERGVKIVQGLASSLPFAIAGTLGGIPATAILGAASNAGQTYDEARLHGVSDGEALRASVPGAVIGSLEGLMGLGTGKFIEQIGKGTIKSLVGGVAEEELQELTSQTLNNVNAKYLSGYDPKRALSEGLWDTFLTTLGTAGLMHGAGVVTNIPRPQIDKAAQAWQEVPLAERPQVQMAQLSTDPQSLASFSPKQRQAALLNWHLEAHPSLKDETGQPKVFYHGTGADLDFFDTQSDSNIGSHFGSKSAANAIIGMNEGLDGTGRTYPVHLNITNPAVTSDIYPIHDLTYSLENVRTPQGDAVFEPEEILDIVRRYRETHPNSVDIGQAFKLALESKGFDGIQYKNVAEDPGHTSYIAFYPHQVKSAFAQEFDPQSLNLSASLTPDRLNTLERRAQQAGTPVALTPESRAQWQQRAQDLKSQLWLADPTTPDFQRLADQQVEAARVAEDAQGIEALADDTALRQHLLRVFMGQESPVTDLLADRPGRPGRSPERGARFYPNRTSDTRGGTVYLKPELLQSFVETSEGDRSGVGALNESVDRVSELADQLETSDPAASAALRAAVDEAQSKGLTQVSLVGYERGQGVVETRRLVRHESFHTGQWSALAQAGDFGGPDIRSLHSNEMVYHPAVAKMASSENGQNILKLYGGDHDIMVAELAAYSAAGQHELFGMTKQEADDFLADYLLDVADTHGPEALDALSGTARLSGPVSQKIGDITNERRQIEAQRRQRAGDFGAQLRGLASVTPESTPTGPSSEGNPEAVEPGIVEGGSEETTGGVVGATGPTATEPSVLDPEQLTPPPGPPTDLDADPAERGPDGLYTKLLSHDTFRRLTDELRGLLMSSGFAYNPLLSPGLQLSRAAAGGHIDEAGIKAALDAAGMTFEDLSQDIELTYSHAGRVLNDLSQVDALHKDLIRKDPKLAAKLLGTKRFMEVALKATEATDLGRSLWERAGDVMRKNFLSRLSTAAVQIWGTTGQIPLDLISGMQAGLGMRLLNPKKWSKVDDLGVASAAKEDILRGARGTLEVASAFGHQIGSALKLKKSPHWQYYKDVVDTLSEVLPEFYGKLHGREGTPFMEAGLISPKVLKSFLTDIKDPVQRREYRKRIETYERREKFLQSRANKVLSGYEWALDKVLTPLTIQEYAFRRPMFVGHLAAELETQGLRIADILADPRLLQQHKAEIYKAVDRATTYTWAYDPKRFDRFHPRPDEARAEQALEGAAYYVLKAWTQVGGPVAATLEAFPRAMINGMKFFYEWGPWGAIAPGWQITSKVLNKERDTIAYKEVHRLAQAMTGTMMYGLALGLRREAGGENWWEIKTGRKDSKGQPIYLNVKRIPQLAFFLGAADIADRMSKGTMNDVSAQKQLSEMYLNSRRVGNPGETGSIDWFLRMWSSGNDVDPNQANKALRPIGDWLSFPLTPFTNLRDMWAQFDLDEGAKRDVRERPLLGPSLDKLPWFRRSLPLAEGPMDQAPQGRSYAPLAEGERTPAAALIAAPLSIGALQLDAGHNFAAREFARLGLSPFRWLKRDPDPKIDREQFRVYTEILKDLGAAMEADQSYRQATNAEKAARWEAIIGGPEGLANAAKQAGLAANPGEAARREALRSVPPLQRQAIGLEKLLPKP